MSRVLRPTKIIIISELRDKFPSVDFDTVMLKREGDKYYVEVFNGLDKIGNFEGNFSNRFYIEMRTHFKWQFGV